jgi:hypothetical protein
MDLRKTIQEEINNAIRGINQRPLLDPVIVNTPKTIRSRRILQFEVDGTFVKEFESIAEANRELGASEKYVSKHLRGRSKTCMGFIFKYKD